MSDVISQWLLEVSWRFLLSVKDYVLSHITWDLMSFQSLFLISVSFTVIWAGSDLIRKIAKVLMIISWIIFTILLFKDVIVIEMG